MKYERPCLDRVRVVGLMDNHISCPPPSEPFKDDCVIFA